MMFLVGGNLDSGEPALCSFIIGIARFLAFYPETLGPMREALDRVGPGSIVGIGNTAPRRSQILVR